jgi:copper(I)-binding protein
MKFLSLTAAAVFAFASAATAHEYKVGDLVINHPMAFETPTTAMSGAGYLSITNNGSEADRLIEVQAEFPRVMLHTTEMKDDVARMIHLDAIDIPAGETVTLMPGGMHVMFMGLAGDPLEIGEEISATLVFEQAGTVEVVFSVEERTGDAMDHSMHQADN